MRAAFELSDDFDARGNHGVDHRPLPIFFPRASSPNLAELISAFYADAQLAVTISSARQTSRGGDPPPRRVEASPVGDAALC